MSATALSRVWLKVFRTCAKPGCRPVATLDPPADLRVNLPAVPSAENALEELTSNICSAVNRLPDTAIQSDTMVWLISQPAREVISQMLVPTLAERMIEEHLSTNPSDAALAVDGKGVHSWAIGLQLRAPSSPSSESGAPDRAAPSSSTTPSAPSTAPSTTTSSGGIGSNPVVAKKTKSKKRFNPSDPSGPNPNEPEPKKSKQATKLMPTLDPVLYAAMSSTIRSLLHRYGPILLHQSAGDTEYWFLLPGNTPKYFWAGFHLLTKMIYVRGQARGFNNGEGFMQYIQYRATRYIYNKNDLWRRMRAAGKPKPQAAADWEERFLPLLEDGAGTPACMEVAIKHGVSPGVVEAVNKKWPVAGSSAGAAGDSAGGSATPVHSSKPLRAPQSMATPRNILATPATSLQEEHSGERYNALAVYSSPRLQHRLQAAIATYGKQQGVCGEDDYEEEEDDDLLDEVYRTADAIPTPHPKDDDLLDGIARQFMRPGNAPQAASTSQSAAAANQKPPSGRLMSLAGLAGPPLALREGSAALNVSNEVRNSTAGGGGSIQKKKQQQKGGTGKQAAATVGAGGTQAGGRASGGGRGRGAGGRASGGGRGRGAGGMSNCREEPAVPENDSAGGRLQRTRRGVERLDM